MKKANYKNWHRKHAKVWKIMPSPARPSRGELAIFRKYLDEYRKKVSGKTRVLILGATPEFRDMCNRKDVDVTCVDINQPIYQALTLLQERPNLKENYIRGNWLTFINKGKFDVILGDAVTAMLPLNLYPQFFKNMNYHLKKTGFMIVRLPYQDQRFNIPIDRVIRNYRNIANKDVHIYTATYNFLVMNYINKKLSSIGLSFLGKKIRDLLNGKVITKKEYDQLEPYYKNLTLELSYPKEDYIFSVIAKYFSILSKEFSLDYLTSYCNPIFVFSKK